MVVERFVPATSALYRLAVFLASQQLVQLNAITAMLGWMKKKLHIIAKITALRLPSGLPFGREHFVVVERFVPATSAYQQFV